MPKHKMPSAKAMAESQRTQHSGMTRVVKKK